MIREAISVVIPVYNSEKTLSELVQRLHVTLENRGARFEIILVNDGSRDGSWAKVCELATRWSAIRGIDLSRNFGQHNALLCGIRVAQHPIVVTLDDDLQHPPEEIPQLLDCLAEGHDVVYGTPSEEQHSRWRNAASVSTKLVLGRLIGVPTFRSVGAFRAFRTRLRDAFADYCSSSVSIDVLLAWGTTRFAAVPVRHAPRLVGKSNYNLRKLCAHAFNLITGFSILPLRFASILGFGIVLFGVGVFFWVLLRALVEGDSVPGFPFLACIVSIFSGTQLLSLGIMGEYLGRIYFRLLEKPSYVVRVDHAVNKIEEAKIA
jgi:glycosyltransferase involved in cell wall biosynthesis